MGYAYWHLHAPPHPASKIVGPHGERLFARDGTAIAPRVPRPPRWQRTRSFMRSAAQLALGLFLIFLLAGVAAIVVLTPFYLLERP